LRDKDSETQDCDKDVLSEGSRHLRLDSGCKVQRDGTHRAKEVSQWFAESAAESKNKEGLEKTL